MSRKNIIAHFPMFASADISTNQTSPTTDLSYLDNAGITVSWAGTSPSGQLVVECANPSSDTREADYVWHALDFGSNIVIAGNTGSHVISMNQLPFTKIRLRYASTSGTGTLSAALSIKQVGG